MSRAAGLVLLLAACNPHDSDSLPLPRVDPAEVGLSMAGLDSVTDFLRDRVAEGAFPGGVLVVGRHGAVAYVSAVGRYGDDDARPVGETTIYDLASLTKVIGLTTAVMLLVADDELGLERRVAHYLPEFSDPRKADITVRHLLTHSSGLTAWAPLYLETPTADSALQWIFRSELESSPGTEYRYSDLGAIVLTQIVERIAGASLDAMLGERVFAPLGMADTRFRPPPALSTRIAPTELDPWRGRVIRGEVHDENAFHLGGVSGHAGLFSTGLDLARFAIWLLDAHHDRLDRDDLPFLPASLVRQFTTRQPGPEGSTRALG